VSGWRPSWILPIKSSGKSGAAKTARTGVIDVAVIQSLQRKGEVKDFVAEYGHVIVGRVPSHLGIHF